jgi:hypothetical protein
MVWSLRRVSALVLTGGLVLGILPQVSAAHCQATKAKVGHHADHGPGQKDTDRAEQCPHCPPVECQRHQQCVFAGDLSVIESPPRAAQRPDPVGYLRWARFGSINPIQPPTPPPQSRG